VQGHSGVQGHQKEVVQGHKKVQGHPGERRLGHMEVRGHQKEVVQGHKKVQGHDDVQGHKGAVLGHRESARAPGRCSARA